MLFNEYRKYFANVLLDLLEVNYQNQSSTKQMATHVPTLKLNNGLEMPTIALGTYLGYNQNGSVKSIDNQLKNVVSQSIVDGYRHIDTAAIYDTEEEVGMGVREKINEGVVRREDIFVTTKLWNTRHNRDQVKEAIQESLKKLSFDYVDLFIIHWPIGLNEDCTFSEVDYMETWKGMEEVYKLGLAKSIGVSNFNKQQLARVIKNGGVKPAVLQIEIHPQLTQTELVSYAQSEGITVMAYSPFGSLVSRYGVQAQGLKDDDALVRIARRYGKTPAQVVLRWLIDRNIVPIPKTVSFDRLKENINIFDFKLDEEEIKMINSYNTNTRYTLPSFWQSHPYYPFEKIDNPVDNPFGKTEGA